MPGTNPLTPTLPVSIRVCWAVSTGPYWHESCRSVLLRCAATSNAYLPVIRSRRTEFGHDERVFARSRLGAQFGATGFAYRSINLFGICNTSDELVAKPLPLKALNLVREVVCRPHHVLAEILEPFVRFHQIGIELL